MKKSKKEYSSSRSVAQGVAKNSIAKNDAAVKPLHKFNNTNNVISRYKKPSTINQSRFGLPKNIHISDDNTAATGGKNDQYLYANESRQFEANYRLAMANSPFRIKQHSQGKKLKIPHGMFGSKTIKQLDIQLDPIVALPVNLPSGMKVNANNSITESPSDCKKTAECVLGIHPPDKIRSGGAKLIGEGNLPGIQRLSALGVMQRLDPSLIEIMVDVFVYNFQCSRQLKVIKNAFEIATKNKWDQESNIRVNYPIYKRDVMNLAHHKDDIQKLKVGALKTEFNRLKKERDSSEIMLASLEKKGGLTAKKQRTIRTQQKMDKFADPEYGEAYGSISGGKQRQKESMWNYHWGGIIMKTQTDNITFENHASSMDTTAWDVRMYGRPQLTKKNKWNPPKKGQSWHEQWSEKDFGDNPSTFIGRR